MLPTSVASLLVHFLSLFTGNHHRDSNVSATLKFELRHLHAISSSTATVLFSDVSSPELLQTLTLSDSIKATTYSIKTSLIKTHRPSSFASFSNARLRSLQFGENEWVDWEEDEIVGPNVESRETLLELAKMTNNAYFEPNETGWYGLNGTWNVVRLSPLPSIFQPPYFNQSNMFYLVLSFRMGTRQGWVSWSRLRHIQQLNSRRFNQRHFCRYIRWRWTYS